MESMKKQSIFKASFEESLNLQDDSISGEFSNKNLASAQEKEKYRGTLKSYVWLTVLTIVFIIGPNWLITALTNYLYHHSEDSPLLPPVHNFLPNWLFIIFLLIWLLLILFGKRFSQQFILIYRGQFHLFVTFLIWLIVEMNLFLLTFLYSTMKATGTILFFVLFGLMCYIIVRSRRTSLLSLLYGKQEDAQGEQDWLGTLFHKVGAFIFKYGFGVIVVLLIFRLIFPQMIGLSLDILGVLLIWFVGDLLFVMLEIYLIFPFMLQGYYKWKYPEDYREWEGQSVEEWYGKAYLKKRPELLEKDSGEN
jgi:putative membrane protein